VRESAARADRPHVHLRPDDVDATPAERYLTADNAERYREVAAERGIEELGVAEHVYRFTQALDVWQHELWRHSARDDLDAYCGFVREETDLKLGIEADFIPGREDRMAELLAGRDFDYVVGSIHFVGDGRSTTTATTSGYWQLARKVAAHPLQWLPRLP
jgi:histidinol-phosphatase (PHP family)